MSSILRKIDQAINPEQREYATGQPTGTGNVHRGAATTTGMGANHHGTYTDQAQAGNNTYVTGGSLHNSGNQPDAYGRHLPGPAPNTAGPHRSDILNKLDPRVDSDMSNPQTRAAHAAAMRQATGPAPNTAGPHRSDLLNKLDPTVDSDLGAGRGAGMGGHQTGGMRVGAYEAPAQTGYNQQGYMSGGAGVPGNVAEGTYGPHKSRLANALDPRVDSDADSRRYAGAPGAHGQQVHGQHAYGQQAYGEQAYGQHAHGHHEHGRHAYGEQAYGAGQPTYAGGPAGTNAAEGTYGPHRSRIANTMDPRVDSDNDRRGGAPGYAGGQPAMQPMNNSTATTNTGPHKSSLLNKLDPNVDSKTGQMKPPRHI